MAVTAPYTRRKTKLSALTRKYATASSIVSACAPMNSSLTWATRPSYGEVPDYVDTDYWNVDSTVLWDITPAAKGWYDGTMPNYGLAMTSNGNTSTKCRAWFSYFRVSFIVSYRNVNGIESYYTYQTLGLGNAGTAYLSDFTGQLTLAKTVCS